MPNTPITRRLFAAGLGAACLMPLTLADAEARRTVNERRRRRVQRLIVREARRLGLPPALALAVAHVESDFNPSARSNKGARGVMQIMPATARGEYGIHPDRLWDPRLNIRMGLHFLATLIDRYRGRVDLALSYYNGGSAVGTWPNARVIPWTRGYVRRVRSKERHYRKALYRGNL